MGVFHRGWNWPDFYLCFDFRTNRICQQTGCRIFEKGKKLRMTPSFLAQTMRKMELPCTVGGTYLKDGDFSLGHIKFSLGTGESISQK